MRSGTGSVGRISYGDSSDYFVASTDYDHTTNRFRWYANNQWVMNLGTVGLSIGNGVTVASYKLDITGTGRFTELLHANKGIVFPATQVASGNANTLDDYEEGAWTPLIRDNVGNYLTSYSYQVAKYTKVGRLVTITGRVGIGGSISPLNGTGSVRIYGLPFIEGGGGQYSSVCVGYGASLIITSGTNLSGFISTGSSYISLTHWDTTIGTTYPLVNEISTGGNIMFTATYMTTT